MTVWIALGLGIMNLALWALAISLVLRAWKKIAPAVTPMLSMFAAPPERGRPQTEPAAQSPYIPPDNLL